MQQFRRYPGTLLSVELAAILGLVATTLATKAIATGDWGGWLSIFWLEPGARILSLEYFLFAVTAMTFVAGGVLAFSTRYWRGVMLCGTACFIAWICIAILAPGEGTSSGRSEVFLSGSTFFGLPGILLLVRGLRLMRDFESGSSLISVSA